MSQDWYTDNTDETDPHGFLLGCLANGFKNVDHLKKKIKSVSIRLIRVIRVAILIHCFSSV